MNRCIRSIFLLLLLNSGAIYADTVSVAVQVDGVSGDLLENVLSSLSIKEQADHTLLTDGRMKRLHGKADKEIGDALKPFGFYRTTVSKHLSMTGPNQWVAIYIIDPGPPLPIGSVHIRIEGDAEGDKEFREMVNKLPLRVGDTLNHAQYASAKTGFIKLAAERGYFDAKFVEHQMRIDLDSYTASIELHLQSGSRYRFGQISLQQEVLDTDFLSRFVPFQQGDPYTVEQVLDLQRSLNDSQYFQDVEITLDDEDTALGTVPVHVLLTPRPRNSFILGTGYGTDTGFRGKLGWEMPRVNEHGHRWDSELKLSQIGSSLSTRYRIPVFNPRTDELQFTGGVVTEQTEITETRINTLGTNLVHTRGHWRENLSLTFQEENFTIAGSDGRSTLLMPGVNWSRIWGKDRFAPRSGARVSLDFRGASDGAVSDVSFFQSTTHMKVILPAGQSGRLIGRGTAGFTLVNAFVELPPSVRYFTGGSSTVRGYNYNSLGPRDANGAVIGGKHMLIGSIEYEHAISTKWAAAAFYDVGDAVDNFYDPLSKGVGIGVRWRSPVGPIRFDWARALTPEDKPWRIHINIGPDL